MGLIGDLFKLIALPFKILMAVIQFTFELLNATVVFITGIVNFSMAVGKFAVQLLLLPVKILSALTPPYGGGGGSSGGSSRKGRAK